MKFHANQSDCWDNIEPLCTGRLMQQVVLRSLAQIHSDLNIPHAELSGVLDQAPLLLHMYRRESETLEFKFWALVMHILTSYMWIVCGTWQNVETLTEIKEIVDPEMKILSWFNMLFQTSMTFFIIIVLWKTNKRLQKMNGTGCFPCMHNDWRLFVSLLNLKSIMIHHDYLCVIFPVFKAFLWRTKVSKAVWKHDWHHMRCKNFRRKCAMAFIYLFIYLFTNCSDCINNQKIRVMQNTKTIIIINSSSLFYKLVTHEYSGKHSSQELSGGR